MTKEKKKFLIQYSVVFLFLAFVFASFYIFQGKSLINYGGDGFRQYFRALIYIRSYFIEILNNIFVKHTLVTPQWDFAIGEGSDILETFHYYGLGDPINLLSVLVKEQYLYLFYDFSIFLRMFISGIAFAEFCFYKKESTNAILIGSILYSFCSFALCSAYGHLLFINALIYLPLVILGVEKIINKDDWKMLTISVFLSSVSSIYFFYMIVIVTIVYTIVRILFIDRSIKEKLKIVINITCYSFLGAVISGFIFLPSFYSLISNSRLTEIKHNILYEPSYYLDMISNFVYSFSYFGGYTLLGLFSTVNLFANRNKKFLKTLFIIGIVFCCIPFFGKLFNGMTYVTDRWLFIMDFLVCYIVVDSIENYEEDKHIAKYIFVLIPYMIFCSIYKSGEEKIFFLLLTLGLLMVFLIGKTQQKKYKKILLLSVSIMSILVCLFFNFSPLYWNYSNRGTDIKIINDMKNEEHSVFDVFNDDSFYRYSGNSLTTNQDCLGEKSSTGYYWSIANSDVVNFRKELGLSDRNNHHYDSYDDSFILNTLSCVKYYIGNNDEIVPYNYEYNNTINKYKIYKSKIAMPLIYGYDNYIREDDFIKYNEIQKQEILTELVVLSNNNYIEKKDIVLNSEMIDYQIERNGLEISNNTICSFNEDAYIKLLVNSNKEGEYYLLVEGLESSDSFDLPIKTSKIEGKGIVYKDETNAGYSNRHNFNINIGYHKTFNDVIEIRFPKKLSYKYKSIKVICLPLAQSIINIDKLNCINIDGLTIGNNDVNAKIFTSKDRFVCFAIPYHSGWTLKIDGKETELDKYNLMYMGSYIEKGEHIIELTYETPMLKIGILISTLGILVYVLLCINETKHILRQASNNKYI